MKLKIQDNNLTIDGSSELIVTGTKYVPLAAGAKSLPFFQEHVDVFLGHKKGWSLYPKSGWRTTGDYAEWEERDWRGKTVIRTCIIHVPSSSVFSLFPFHDRVADRGVTTSLIVAECHAGNKETFPLERLREMEEARKDAVRLFGQ